MRSFTTTMPIVSVLFFGAIFGFFYAWICSTMWAFDTLDPRVAMEVMQVVNANVRNLVFFPVFMLTPVIGGVAAFLLFRAGQRKGAGLFAAASVVYLAGGLLLTMFANVPMNENLAATAVPATEAEAAAIWEAYSPTWQTWNILRTVFSGVALALAGFGLMAMRTPANA